MPTILREDRSVVTDAAEQQAIIAALGLGVAHHPFTASFPLDRVLTDHRISPDQADRLLDLALPAIGTVPLGADVIGLFPDTPDLDRLDALFRRPHRHRDNERRYILAGRGVFGFVLPDGAQVEIVVGPGDLIDVPAGAEHWFHLDGDKTVVAVRLFGENPDWQADFTGTVVRVGAAD